MNKPRVLVVEDNLEMCSLHKLTLEKAGFEVMLANDGNAALTLAQQSKPDVILTDIMMPNMDGIELIEIIRKMQSLAGIPIFVLSAGTEQLLDKASQAGATKVIEKPLNPTQLWAELWGLLPDTSSAT
jgi:CheY-like chemotaxis protein